MCSGSESGSYVRLIDIVYHSTLGLRVIKKKKVVQGAISQETARTSASHPLTLRLAGAAGALKTG